VLDQLPGTNCVTFGRKRRLRCDLSEPVRSGKFYWNELNARHFIFGWQIDPKINLGIPSGMKHWSG
jgi:hypothetical protein